VWGERREPQHRGTHMLGIAALTPTYLLYRAIGKTP
jgi:hypothetical protein